ncbi:hypothetical protein BKA82DRAFT_4113843 [Pisolithus tinctorius]|nr:hypothetical protein BKA82DRAFT_4113843 [Pisolithus tinctorius]
MQSPPSHSVRPSRQPTPYATTLKRARSPGPGSPTTAERQVVSIDIIILLDEDETRCACYRKWGRRGNVCAHVNRRVSFAASDVSNPCHFPLSLTSSASMPLHFSGHQPGMGYQDDWVRAPGGGGSDENMIIDMQPHSHPYSDSPITPEESAMSILSSPRSSSHNHHHNTAIAIDDHNTPYQFSTTITTTSSSSNSPSPPPSSSTSSMAPSAAYPPAIYFSPATPSSEAPTPPSHDYAFSRTGTRIISSISMGKSCLPPSPCSSGPGRKQRFTMGPRWDGHWVHLD